MSDFYREAIAIAVNSLDHALVPARHPATLEEAASILSKLSPEQRCDAIYADWLIQLHNPGGGAQIQIRDLLLGQGAMDAHYLAELAQNADDAGASHLVVAMEDDWLLVANNGKPLNSLNLLGLCRFFVHSNGQVVGLTPDTIGRFGIGFKASHRVAEQVLVSTWSERDGEAFGFRLPIAISKTSLSHPNTEVLERLTQRWRDLTIFNDSLRPEHQLGHCTPEYLESAAVQLPEELRYRVSKFQAEFKCGTWFGMKLHVAGAKDASRYLSNLESGILGVNPMFLKNICQVDFQNRTITKKKGNPVMHAAGNIRATRLTFTLSSPGSSSRSDRLILLEPRESDGIWKITLPVNSDWKLYSGGDDLPISSGGGLHAYLPLSGLVWPHRCHIHLDLPPNLSRSSWNPDQDQEVKRAFTNISERLADWLLENSEAWHADWQPSLMLGKVEAQGPPTAAAVQFMTSFRNQLLEKNLVRSIWGNMVAAEKARELLLEDGDQPKSAWFRMAGKLRSNGQELLPIVPTMGSLDVLDLPRMTTDAAIDLLLEISGLELEKDQDFWSDYIWCAMGCILQPTNANSRTRYLEKVLGVVPITRENGEGTTLKSLAATEGKSRLSECWHTLFSKLSGWLAQSLLAENSLYGCLLKTFLKNLSQKSETPTTWAEVVAAIEAGNVNVLRGIWMQGMPPCPHNMKKTVAGGLHVFKADGSAVSLANTWVLSDYGSPLIRILFAPSIKDLMMSKIQLWDLRQSYIDVVKAWIPSELKNSIVNLTVDGMTASLAETIFVSPESLPLELKECVSGVLKEFFEEQLTAIIPNIKNKIILVGEVPGSKILKRLGSFVSAPAWLTKKIITRFAIPLYVHESLSIEFAVEGSLTATQRERFGKLLLDGFPDWKDSPDLDNPTCDEISDYFSSATGNWTVRLPGNKNRRLNEFLSFSEGLDLDDYAEINSLVLAGQSPKFDRVRLLPPALHKFISIRHAALSTSKFSIGSLDRDEIDNLDEVPNGLIDNRWFSELRKRVPNATIVSYPVIDKLVYSFGDVEISISNPAFAYHVPQDNEWIVVFGSGERQPEEDGKKYEAILNHYSILCPEDAQVRTCLRKSGNYARFYHKNREKIVNRLREVHATDLGYEARHVLRELLQNAETSYVTCARKNPDGLRSFNVHLEPLQNGSEFRVSVTHHGRTFNESLSNGQEIDDIMRLCSVESTIPNVPGWRGRFNKGFKSLFQVTEGVKVTSGPYSFELRDLMLLDPVEPQPDPELIGRPTTFEFTIPLRTRRDFLSEGGKPPRFGAFVEESLVFLQNIDHIEITEPKKTLQEFRIERKQAPGLTGWEITTITDPNGKELKESRFLTSSGAPGGKRFCVAIKLTEGRKPFRLELHKRRLFRTFPLEQPAEFASFLIEADFSTDQGRLGLREFEQSGEIVLSAIRSVIHLVKEVIEREGMKANVWLDWVTWLDLRSLARAAEVFPTISIELRKDLKSLEEWLLTKIPIGGVLRSIEHLVVPSPLLFRLMADPQYSFILKPDTTEGPWVSEEIATVIRQDFERSKIETLLLNAHVEKRIGEGADIGALSAALATAYNRRITINAFEQMELMHARWIIDPPVSPVRPPETTVPPDDSINFDDILESWDEEAAVQEFTVAGPLGALILPSGGGDSAIAALLKKPNSIEGKAAWYRLLCLGCSFSTLLGTSPRDRVIGLWGNRLGDDFWDKTIPDSLEAAGKADFNRNLDVFFEKIIHKLFRSNNASGEDAEFWRRVFYDFRKMHYFVFRNHLPETILDYTSFPQADGPGLINFLKTGQIQDAFRDPNQTHFTGVIGQSMSSPLLFIMRELARLEVIDERFRAACYYMNRPSRRIAARLGWIQDNGFTVPTFSDLLTYSQQVHKNFEEEESDMLGFYDLPLQWYALSR